MATHPRPLAGTVVAITGAARGIGRATAAALVARGARVALGDLDRDLVERTARELGGETVALALDVTDPASFARFLDEAEARLGPLDALVNNAGVMHVGPFVDEPDAVAVRQVEVNLLGVLVGSKLALRRFLARGRGHLVNVASSAGKVGIAGGATYSATKHAVVGLTDALRVELRGSGVETTVVMPTPVNTELAAGLQRGRGIGVIEPEQVAAAIVAALARPRHDVFVPRAIGPLAKVAATLPRGLAEWLGRLMRTDRILAGADRDARAAYERRALGAADGARAHREASDALR